jgi:hypothetical protein
MLRIPQCLESRFIVGGKVVSLTSRPSFVLRQYLDSRRTTWWHIWGTRAMKSFLTHFARSNWSSASHGHYQASTFRPIPSVDLRDKTWDSKPHMERLSKGKRAKLSKQQPWRPIGLWDVEAHTFLYTISSQRAVMLSALRDGRALLPMKVPCIHFR